MVLFGLDEAHNEEISEKNQYEENAILEPVERFRNVPKVDNRVLGSEESLAHSSKIQADMLHTTGYKLFLLNEMDAYQGTEDEHDSH